MTNLLKKIFKRKDKKEEYLNPNIVNCCEENDDGILDLMKFSAAVQDIQGMTDDETGKYFFTVATTQSVKGDIVEIGSWQGKSTAYFAKAVEAIKNGTVYAIDHFKGNTGKERVYKVEKDDLSDLEEVFLNNMKRKNLDKYVNLLNMPSQEAAEILREKNVKIRLLFIDGEHTYEGVKRDFSNYIDMVVDDGIIIFHDYHVIGIRQFVKELIEQNLIYDYYSYGICFFAKKQKLI